MQSRIAFGALAVVSLAGLAGCGSDTVAVVAPQSTTYVSVMNGANEVPARPTTATGTATYTLTGNTLSFIVTVAGLSGPATASHIHVGSAAVAGGVLLGFVTSSVGSGNVTAGTIDLTQPISNGTTSISGDSLKVLLNNGQAYTNIHTALYGGGEIRGQIIKQ